MFLARVEYGGDVKVYKLADGEGLRCGGWKFSPRLGAEGSKMRSGLCNGGWAAISPTASEAVGIVEDMRVRGHV
jgi:hypothetical protein